MVKNHRLLVTSVVLPAAPVPLTLVITGCDENAKSAKSIESAFAIPAIVPEKSRAVSRCSVPGIWIQGHHLRCRTAKFQNGRLADFKLSVACDRARDVQFPVANIDCAQVFYCIHDGSEAGQLAAGGNLQRRKVDARAMEFNLAVIL